MADREKVRIESKNIPLVQVSGAVLVIIGVSLPFAGLISCVLLSVVFDFEQSTATHCRVTNYLPSVSSAIGGFTPQRYVWRMCIALHSAPRFMALVAYYKYFQNRKVSSNIYSHLARLASFLNLVENVCLLLLTFVSSTENYHFHERSFIIFLVTSELYMIISLALFYWSLPEKATPTERKSLRYKRFFFLINCVSCFSAVYFFYRHNTFCEAGVYSLFAVCEYLVVLSNIAYHGTALFEFGSGKLTYTLPTSHSEGKSQ